MYGPIKWVGALPLVDNRKNNLYVFMLENEWIHWTSVTIHFVASVKKS